MGVLTNPRHELFAQELAKGKSASEAYTLAGNRPCRQNAARAPDCVSDRDRGHGAIAIRKYRRTLPRVSRGLLDDLKRQIGQWHNMGVGIFGSASR